MYATVSKPGLESCRLSSQALSTTALNGAISDQRPERYAAPVAKVAAKSSVSTGSPSLRHVSGALIAARRWSRKPSAILGHIAA
jgi:hypothetical protein